MHVILRAEVLLDTGVNLIKEVFAQAIVLHQHLARSGLLSHSQATALSGNLEETLEVGHIRHKADVGDTQLSGNHLLKIDASNRDKVLYIL